MYRHAAQSHFSRILATIIVTASSSAFAQTQQQPAPPGFDVASIRLHSSTDSKAYVQALQGRLVMQNFSLKQLILFAYDIPSTQVLGVQGWMNSNHYDIQAITESNRTVKQVEGPMLQALLEDRFHLKVHRETMERPVYELTVDKGGVKMQLSKKGSCAPYSMDSPPPLPAPSAPRPVYCDFPHLSGDGVNWTLDGIGVSIRKLAASLSRSGLDRPVIDSTGLTGPFDLHLKWTAEDARALGSAAVDDPANPSIFTALKEQTGLKLESSRGPLEILVIDHVEKPSEN
jgi:uncharacterized protein (TIGR03435 family)